MKKSHLKGPLVSILMTAYNAEKFIFLALESLVCQTYRNLEIIVVDDGSIDKTAEIIRNFAQKDKRLKFFRLAENLGPSLASNFGLKKARGEFIARMDADDIAFPDRIEKQVAFLIRHPQVVMVGGQCFLINEEDEVIGEKDFPTTHHKIYQSLFSVNPIQHPSCMINRKLLPKGKIYYHNHSVLAHDLELVFELAQYGKLANLKEKILYYRQYPGSLSLKNPKETFQATLEIRLKAVREYEYKPSFGGWLTHLVQTLVIIFLPGKLIYPIFKIVRLSQIKESRSRGLAYGWRNVFTGARLREVWQ